MHYKLLHLVQNQSKQYETNSSLQFVHQFVIRKGESIHGFL